jgi:ABC-type transport system involved in cytochrome bd biosynthesis fused ATPase/permease subunit
MKNIVILDEPTEGLDEPTANALMASLVEYCRDRALIVISHHESDRSFATRALRLEGGLLSELEVPAGSSREDQLV